MKEHLVIVPGYGIPKNILTDLNYTIYLRVVMNCVYELLSSDAKERASMILCGGYTDIHPPFRRTEAAEMKRFLRTLLSRQEMNGVRKRLKIILETNSLSTLENIRNARQIVDNREIQPDRITVFCEQTRHTRMQWLVKELLPNMKRVDVTPIDFDQSANRYRDRELILRREQLEMRAMMWALQSDINMQEHHRMFVEKRRRLREAGPAKHVDAVHAWQQEMIERFEGKALPGEDS